MNVDGSFFKNGAAYRRAARDYSWPRNRHWPVHCHLMNNISVQTSDCGILSVTKLCCILHDHVQHRLNICRRAGDDAQNLARRRLLLQRFLEFLKQPDVLDSDDGLVGERFQKLDLGGGEGIHLGAACSKRSNEFSLQPKGNGQVGTPAVTSGMWEIILCTDIGNVERAMLAHPAMPWVINPSLSRTRWYGPEMSLHRHHVIF